MPSTSAVRIAERLLDAERALEGHPANDTPWPVDDWHSFPETSPHPGSRVSVRSAANNIYVAWLFEDAWHIPFHDGTLGDEQEVVTHWRPLPPRPRQVEPFVMTYSGFTTGSPVNIAARDGPVFQIHAEDGKEVQRLVEYLNEWYEEHDT